jgi:hypothetical protein
MKMNCPGSYGDGAPYTTKHGTRVVTAACPVCGKRVAYVTAHGLEHKPRVLGAHAAKETK